MSGWLSSESTTRPAAPGCASNDWTVIVVRRGDFTGERLDRWLGELRDALQPDYSNRRWKF